MRWDQNVSRVKIFFYIQIYCPFKLYIIFSDWCSFLNTSEAERRVADTRSVYPYLLLSFLTMELKCLCFVLVYLVISYNYFRLLLIMIFGSVCNNKCLF